MCGSLSKYQLSEDEFSDGECSFSEKDVCHHCQEECAAKDKPFRFADVQYSFGIYAGKYCENCWRKSGYRDATDPEAEFDPIYAGESLEDDY